jgi:hypothetical protein
MTFCPSCGKEIEIEWDYCMHCGADVTELGDLSSQSSSATDTGNQQSDDEDSQLLLELDRAEFKQKIRSMPPYEFENLVGDIWREKGYEVEVSQQSQDKGIDITVQRGGETALIQVKRYAVDNTVGSNEVRKYATLYQQEGDVASVIIITASSFTSQAEELATNLDVEAIDSDDLYETVQDTEIEATVLETSSATQSTEGSSQEEEFINVYEDFSEINTDLAMEVFQASSRAADHDGAEAQFARNGGEEQLRFAVEMRNEWVDIVTTLDELIHKMEPIPERMPQAEFARLISEQIESMRDLSEAYKNGIKYKDKLINSRFESEPLDAGTLSQVDVPNSTILREPTVDIEDLKQDQDVCMTIAAKETGKIGDLSDERKRLIESVKNQM